VASLREAVIWRDRGVPARAEACLARARPLVPDQGDPSLRAQYLYVRGRALRMRGDTAAAETALLEAFHIYDSLGNVRDAAHACDSLGGMAVQALRLDEAWRWAEAALARFTAAGMRAGVAEARVMFGEVERLRGNLVAAEGHYRDALTLARSASPATVIFAWANLGLVLVQLGRWSEAEPYLRDALRDFDAQGRSFYAGAMHVSLLGCAAVRGDFAAWDRHLASAQERLYATGFHDVDVAICAELAAREAGARGEVRRARGAWRIARDQRRALGHLAEAEVAEGEMGAGG
jgi:tetratricopeptide (TPR) repeat protein